MKDTMEAIALALILLLMVGLAGFFSGRYYETHQMVNAPADTLTRLDTVYLPPVHGIAPAKHEPPSEPDRAMIDSIVNIRLAQGADSIRADYRTRLTPKRFAFDIDSVGHTDLTYTPLDDSLKWTFTALPRVTPTKEITRYIEVGSFWKPVAIGGLTVAIIELAALILRR